MPNPLDLLLYGVVFVLVISVLVAAHEWGHYLFARLFGMGAEEFAIGFGKKPLFTWMRRSYLIPLPADDGGPQGPRMIHSGGSALEGGAMDREVEVVQGPDGRRYQRETTNFTVRPWPLGGFVRIKGMVPEVDGSETRIPGGLYSKPPWQRFLVMFAGPLFSILAGILLLVPVYMWDGVTRQNPAPLVGRVEKGYPAQKAGLQAGDRVVSLDGQPISRFYDMIQIVRRSPGQPLALSYERNGQRREATVVPVAPKEPSPVLGEDLEPNGEFSMQAKLGIAPQSQHVHLPCGEAFAEAASTPRRAVENLARAATKPQSLEQNVGGPASMVAATATAVQLGFGKVIWLAAMLSISVGIFNLLPIYPLDGGQMIMALAEMLRGGRRLSMGVQNAVATAGFALVVALIASVLFVDVKRFTPKREEPKVVQPGR